VSIYGTQKTKVKEVSVQKVKPNNHVYKCKKMIKVSKIKSLCGHLTSEKQSEIETRKTEEMGFETRV